MGKEYESSPDAHELRQIRLTGIYVDLPSKTVVLTSGPELVASLKLTPEGVVFDARIHGFQQPSDQSDPAQSATGVEPRADAAPEKPKAVTLQGKLKSKPQVGRPDSRGKPTAWARFAAHEEEHDGAHLYSTTFHKHTVEIALGLEKDTPLTVQGYPHLQDDPGTKRLDTLSVINLLEYPGKPAK